MSEAEAVLEDGEAAEQQAAQENKGPDWLSIANLAFNGSTTYLDTNYRAQWERNIRQHRSQHPTGSKYLSDTWKHKSKFFRPKTRSAIRKNEAGGAAAFFSTQDVVTIDPVNDNDGTEKASAALWKEALNYRLTKSVPWFVTVMGAYQETQVMGAVVSHQHWDMARDCPDPELRPMENIRFDPSADWRNPMGTSPYIIDQLPMYAYEIKERSARGEWVEVTDGELKSAQQYTYDSTRLTREGNRTDPKENNESGIDDFAIVWVHRVIMRRGGKDVLFYTLATEKLLSDPVPLGDAYPWLRPLERPYVMGICIIEAHRNMPSGITELTYQVQAETNDLINMRQENIKLVLNKRYHVKRHKQVDIRSLTRNIAGAVTMMDDPEKDVVPQEFNDVTSSAYAEQDRLNLDFDDLTGSFSGSSVQSNRKLNETVGGMNLLSQEYAEIGDYTLKTFIETWLEPVLSQMLRLEQCHESDAKILLLAGAKAQLIQKFGINTITDDLLRQEMTLTVNVGIGSTNPMKNVERFMIGIDKLRECFGEETVAQRLNFDEVSAELFGKLGYKDGKRFMLDQEDPRVASLMSKIAELTQKVAQKRSPELDAADAAQKRANALKIIVESIFGATQAAEIIAAIPETAPVADAILEAGGYQRPVPAGVDPNLPAPSQPALPPPAVAQNTSPLQPRPPASPIAGFNAGVEGG